MQCGFVGKYKCPESKDDFFYPVDIPEASPPSPKSIFEKLCGTKPGYKLIQVAREWFQIEREAFENKLAGREVIEVQVSFVLEFCRIKSLRVDPDVCHTVIQRANNEETPSTLLRAMMKVRCVVETLVKSDPTCYRRIPFSSICEPETVLIREGLGAGIVSERPSHLPISPRSQRGSTESLIASGQAEVVSSYSALGKTLISESLGVGIISESFPQFPSLALSRASVSQSSSPASRSMEEPSRRADSLRVFPAEPPKFLDPGPTLVPV